MTEPLAPQPSPRDGFQPQRGYNIQGRQRQRSNIARALGALARRADSGDAAITKIFQASLAGAIVAAEEQSAARDAANPT